MQEKVLRSKPLTEGDALASMAAMVYRRYEREERERPLTEWLKKREADPAFDEPEPVIPAAADEHVAFTLTFEEAWEQKRQINEIRAELHAGSTLAEAMDKAYRPTDKLGDEEPPIAPWLAMPVPQRFDATSSPVDDADSEEGEAPEYSGDEPPALPILRPTMSAAKREAIALRTPKTMPLRLTDAQVRSMREASRDGVTIADLVQRFGVGKSLVSSICIGKSYTHVPMPEGMPVGSPRGTKLDEAQVSAMRRERQAGATYRSLGVKYGVSPEMACRICRGKSWAHVPMPAREAVAKAEPMTPILPEPAHEAAPTALNGSASIVPTSARNGVVASEWPAESLASHKPATVPLRQPPPHPWGRVEGELNGRTRAALPAALAMRAEGKSIIAIAEATHLHKETVAKLVPKRSRSEAMKVAGASHIPRTPKTAPRYMQRMVGTMRERFEEWLRQRPRGAARRDIIASGLFPVDAVDAHLNALRGQGRIERRAGFWFRTDAPSMEAEMKEESVRTARRREALAWLQKRGVVSTAEMVSSGIWPNTRSAENAAYHWGRNGLVTRTREGVSITAKGVKELTRLTGDGPLAPRRAVTPRATAADKNLARKLSKQPPPEIMAATASPIGEVERMLLAERASLQARMDKIAAALDALGYAQ